MRKFAVVSLLACLAVLFGAAPTLVGQDTDVTYDYLIVHADNLADAAEAFAEYRGGRGHTVATVSMSEVFEASDKDNAADSLAGFVRGFHDDQGSPEPFFVLLLGDVHPQGAERRDPDYVPAAVIEDPGPENRSICTDNPVACADSEDILPDFAVGRISVHDNDEAMTVLEKIRRYENESTGGTWRKRLTFFAGEGHFGESVDRLIENMFIQMVSNLISYDYDINMTYGNPTSEYFWPPSGFSDRVSERISEGALMLQYIGHGSPTSIDDINWNGRSYPICDMDDMTSVETEGRFPIMALIACYTGMFDLRNGEDCIGEAIVKAPGAPIAVFASSRVSHPYVNAIIQKNLMESMLGLRTATLGEAARIAKRMIYEIGENDAYRATLENLSVAFIQPDARENLYYSNLQMYNLLGDPALEIRYPENTVELDVENGDEEFHPGDTVRVTGHTDFTGVGRIIVSLESSRPVILGEVERGESLSDEQIVSNNGIANDKVVDATGVDLNEDGTFEVEFTVPDPLRRGGKFYVKAFVPGEHECAAGSMEIRISRRARRD